MPTSALEAWREHRYRALVPMSHEQFLNEPSEVVDWEIHLADMTDEIRAEAQERADKEASRRG